MRLLYPEQRRIAPEAVISWAADEWSNNAPRQRCKSCGVVTVAEHFGKPVSEVRAGEFAASDPANPCCGGQTSPVYDDGLDAPADLADCVAYLEDLGVATFARARI